MKLFAEIFIGWMFFCMSSFILIYIIWEIKENKRDSRPPEKPEKREWLSAYTPYKLIEEIENE